MKTPHFHLVWTAAIVSFGGNYHFGYQLSVLNPTKSILQPFLNNSAKAHYGHDLSDGAYRFLWSLILNALLLGALAALPLIAPLAERAGRRTGLAISSSLFVIGTIPAALSQQSDSLELLVIGRFILGLGCGLGAGLQSLYLNEISPPQSCGFISALNGLFVEVGFALGIILGLPTVWGNSTEWGNLFWIELLPSLLLLVCLPFLPESPKFLFAQGRLIEATTAINLYSDTPEEASERIAEIEADLALEKQSLSILQLLRKRHLRLSLLLGSVVCFMTQFSGITTQNFFTTYFIEAAGLDANAAANVNVAIGVSSVIGGLIGAVCVEWFGRRPLLLLSSVSVLLINIVYLVLFRIQETEGPFGTAPYIFLVSSCLFMVVFSIGLGPLAWFLAGELVPHHARSATVTLSLVSFFASGFIAGLVFLPLEGAVGSWSFLLYIVPLALGIGLTGWKLPETKGRAIGAILGDLNPKEEERPILRNGTPH